jgi:hypothetical protein
MGTPLEIIAMGHPRTEDGAILKPDARITTELVRTATPIVELKCVMGGQIRSSRFWKIWAIRLKA